VSAPPVAVAPEPEHPRRRVAGIKSLVLTIAFVFLLIVAMLLDIPYLYIMAIALALLQPISYGVAARWSPRFEARRVVPGTGVEGKPLAMELVVDVRGGLPQGAVAIRDPLPAVFEQAGESRKSAWAEPDAWDGHQGRWPTVLTPLVRGVHRFAGIDVEATDPLGLFFFESRIECPGEVVVHPAPVASRRASSGGSGWLGVRERDGAARRGDGLDFHGVRDYRPGDSARRVHWRTTARRGSLSVVEFEKAFQQDISVVLDHGLGCDLGEGRETPLEYAVKAAATRIDQVLASGGGISVATSAGTLRVRAGEPDADVARFRLFDMLARLEPTADCDPAALLQVAGNGDLSRVELITFRNPTGLAGALAHAAESGHQVDVLWLDPVSFGGAIAHPPSLEGVSVVTFKRSDSPWLDGGQNFLSKLEFDGR
jgi:uncharacterized protein (DUF58 family)